ncbi:liprin-beta-1 isoform X2 [Denticeps clupeoides]|uniref:liprin-beta-1 isoform X2 n=1 Tax=Denticeps clupeoides TaxID=299321 RepID=UPI0010A439F4|nr:liprin-beta-1-like isoform X2 [Denticeps clupeoides]
MMTDASEMLAAALEQMDGIIAGSKAMQFPNGLFDCQSPTSPFVDSLRALHLLEDLRGALELMDADERESLRCQVPGTTAEGLVDWLQGRLTNGHNSVDTDLVYQERLTRLESDKECLVLQVSILTDQVEVQGEKIKDLDTSLEEHRQKLNATEGMLQQELLSRSALETQKLELLNEVSSLKMILSSVEKERKDNESLYQEVNDLRFRVTDMENERLQYEKKLKTTQEELMTLHEQVEEREEELRRLRDQLRREVVTPSADRDMEVQRMKRALETLVAANNEKEVQIEELQQSLLQYQSGQVRVMAPGNEEEQEENVKALSVAKASVSVSMETETTSPGTVDETDEPQLIPCSELLDHELRAMSTMTSGLQSPGVSLRNTDRVAALEEVRNEPPLSPPTQRSPPDRDSFGSKKARTSFGRGFFKIRGGKRAASSPDLAETERKGTEHLDLAGVAPCGSQDGGVTQNLSSPTAGRKKPKGLRKLFGRLRKSQSTSFDLDAAESEFRRGGVRATAGPRLGWSRDLQQGTSGEVGVPFARWSKEQVCAWMQDLGLGLHVGHAQQWIQSGQTLLQASQQDLEKELGIRNHLHRKKLQLALQALGTEEDDPKSSLDFGWVTRWLDDVGLPQYKSQFDEGRVDGRMLHYMTVDDLLSLKVGSVLHHLSVKRAIQVLRLSRFEPNCLRRRPSDENNVTPAEVCQWTNHRVMEWLRSVDLAEYAPNLRGSGVHGGLMVLEPRFNVEAMALLLNIPPNKTLLRRHLATHFHLLIGPEAQRLKQECLENPDYALLTATARVKPRRLSFGGFGTLRRKRPEDGEDLLCPLDTETPQGSSFHRSLKIYEEHLEQIEDSEGTVRQIGVFSEGINNLTSMLKDDDFFMDVSTHSADVPATRDDQ